MPDNDEKSFDYCAEYGYDDDIPWPENMPRTLRKMAKHLDIYKTKPKLGIFFSLELEAMESHTKMAEICNQITEEDLWTIFAKIGLWVPEEYHYVFDKRAPQNEKPSGKQKHHPAP